MALKHLSTTFIGNFSLCPRRAWRSYDRRNELGNDNEGTEPTRFGNVAHNTLEYIHNQLVTETITVDDLEDEYVDDVFKMYWVEGACYDFDYYMLGRDKIGDFVRRSVKNRLGKTVATELLFVYDLQAKTVVIDPPDPMKVVAAIQKLGHVAVMSKIDRIDYVVTDEGKIKIEIFDYKTNAIPFTRYEIENSKQLGIYHMVGKALYPEADEIECIYDMVRHGRFPVVFPEFFIEYLRDYLTDLASQADKAKDEERLNKYCCYCEIRASCETYKAELTSELPTVVTDNVDFDARFDELELLQIRKKAIGKRIDELNEMFTVRVIEEDGQPFAISDKKEIYLSSQRRTKYDMVKVYDALKNNKALVLLRDCGSIVNSNIERVLKSRPDLKAEIEPAISITMTKPSVKVRAIKAGKCNEPELEAED